MWSCLTVVVPDPLFVVVVCVPLQVIFAPNYQNNVGIFDAGTSQFSTVATTGAAATGDFKYYGAAVVGTKVCRHGQPSCLRFCASVLLLCVCMCVSRWSLLPPPDPLLCSTSPRLLALGW